MGQFILTPAHLLGATVLRSLIAECGLKVSDIDEVIIGQVLITGQGQNPARQAAFFAGIPTSVPASTINMLCASGLK